jgi:hypothetical protein
MNERRFGGGWSLVYQTTGKDPSVGLVGAKVRRVSAAFRTALPQHP